MERQPYRGVSILLISLAVAAVVTRMGVWGHGSMREKSRRAPIPFQQQKKPGISPPGSGKIQAAYGNLPMSFELNRGQVEEPVRFLARGRGCSLFLTAN